MRAFRVLSVRRGDIYLEVPSADLPGVLSGDVQPWNGAYPLGAVHHVQGPQVPLRYLHAPADVRFGDILLDRRLPA